MPILGYESNVGIINIPAKMCANLNQYAMKESLNSTYTCWTFSLENQEINSA